MGLATLRIDGFTCVESVDGEIPGWVTTNPVEAVDTQSDLIVNAGSLQAGRSWVEVELLDAASDEVLPGFSHGDCGDIMADSTHHRVKWTGGAFRDAGKSRVKLRFYLCGTARLYSYIL